MNERGFIAALRYDVPTGALVQRIDDVDTGEVTDEPAGWTTPSGGGLNLVTDYADDDLGRTTQELGPVHVIDVGGTATSVRRATWTVYKDETHEVWTGQGYGVVAGLPTEPLDFTLINPVSIVKRDARGNVLEQIRATRASTSGKLQPTDSFPQSSYVRWTTYQYTECCLLSSMRVYHNIPASGSGTEGTNYDETEYGYDSMKRRNRTVSPGGTITFDVFDARGEVIETWVGTNDDGASESDPSGGGSDPDNDMVLVTANEYDGGADGGDGNLTEQTQRVDGSTARVTAFAYDWRDRQVDVDGEVDFFQRSHYDNLDRVVKVERYDTTASGNLVAREETKFDERGRVYRTIQYAVDPDTGTVGGSLADNSWFDDTGNVVQRQPAGLMNGIELEYDSLGRLVKETDPLGAEMVFTHDDAGNRTSLTDAEDNTTAWAFDSVGRVVKETNPLDDTRMFAYDDSGMLSVRTDRMGRVIELDYDDAGRVTEERWKDGSTTVNTLQFTYDPDSRMLTAGDDHSSYAYAYNLNGGMTEVDNDGTPGVPRVVLSAEYNRFVERTSLGAEVASTNDFVNGYGYDALGRMSRITQGANGGSSVAGKRVDFAYGVIGRYSVIDRYADVSGTSLVAKSTYGYDDFARLTGIEHAKGSTSLASHAYTFNAERLIDQHATVDGDSDYDYDDAAQLTEALHSFQTDEGYTYDLTGNRTNTGYSTGDANRLLSDGAHNYEYDAEGNRTKRTTISTSETVEYAWDHRNRLTQVTFKNSSGVTTKEVGYVYDLYDRRIAKLLDSDGDGTVDDEWRFVYDPMVKPELADIVLVFDGSGDLRRRYLHGPEVDQALADEDVSGEVLWPLTDHLRTVRDLAGYDAQGDSTSVVNHVKYDAFGRIMGQSDSSKTPLFSFTGREWDADAGLYYYRARWYDAGAGRFLTEDPIGFVGRDAHLYCYVANSPVMLRDAHGTVAPIIGAGAALVGVVIACALPYHQYALHHYDSRSDKFKHCWVSCAVSRTCSGYISEFAGLGKEVRDMMIAAYCELFPEHEICQHGHGDFWDALADLGANQQCLGWEQFVFGAVGGWIGALCRESCEDCCAREAGNS
jgi:RHS repeat-associated protein